MSRRLVDDRRIIELSPDHSHAVAMLSNKLRVQTDMQTLSQLAAALENMPLAIAQAAAYINRLGARCSPSEYLSKLEKSEKMKTNLLRTERSNLHRDGQDAKNSILMTWQISFEHIRTVRQSAADLLALMSFFDNQVISEKLLVSDCCYGQGDLQLGNERTSDNPERKNDRAVEDIEDDIATLRDFYLVSFSLENHTFQIHRLVQIAVHLWLEQKQEYETWQARSLHRLDWIFPDEIYEGWMDYHTILPHARKMLDANFTSRTDMLALASILSKCLGYISQREYCADGEIMAQRSFEIYEGLNGREHPDTLRAVSDYAVILQEQWKFEEAERWGRYAHDGYKKTRGEKDSVTVGRALDLVWTLKQLDKNVEAETLIREVLQTLEDNPAEETIRQKVQCYMSLGDILQQNGNIEEATVWSRRSLELSMSTLGQNDGSTLVAMNNLALILMEQGELDEAVSLLRQSLCAKEKAYGLDNASVLSTVGNLAAVAADQAQYGEALSLNSRLIETHRRLRGDEHPATFHSLLLRSYVYFSMKRYDLAVHLCQKAAAGFTKALGPDNYITRSCRNFQEQLDELTTHDTHVGSQLICSIPGLRLWGRLWDDIVLRRL